MMSKASTLKLIDLCIQLAAIALPLVDLGSDAPETYLPDAGSLAMVYLEASISMLASTIVNRIFLPATFRTKHRKAFEFAILFALAMIAIALVMNVFVLILILFLYLTPLLLLWYIGVCVYEFLKILRTQTVNTPFLQTDELSNRHVESE
jgi:hypothetical protein